MSTTHKPLVPVPITAVDEQLASRPPASSALLASGGPSGSMRVPAGSSERGSAAPASRPAPLPEISTGKVPVQEFPDERPAAEHLRAADSRSDWERRAEWLEA